MTQYLIAIHHPDDYDPAVVEDEAMARDIDAVNEEMEAAGVRIFLGGLQPARTAKSLRVQRSRQVLMIDGRYLETKEHIGEFWVVEAVDLDKALESGRKAAVACRRRSRCVRFTKETHNEKDQDHRADLAGWRDPGARRTGRRRRRLSA